ncbi:NAD(P)H-dependent flavin oxidoreductase [Gordonia sp. PS3]|uniref:NAD(P)H-dependent flavin oxidoreductase n=1 Tax=Gordonia TaxID=2053 RepID=UPI0005F0943F|nr:MULTISPECIES: nitronate monooxygenase [Gordonia]KJR07443.1 2-nitropropane dioxygenase [Gordonia sihwensis]KXT56696.1 2-nitropropane dioxygenase [Gordonia sp. QH-12]
MFDLGLLGVPIAGAPMAGGTSTPELTAAVSGAGGLGFYGGAYLTPERLREDIRAIAALTDAPFGVNLFVPEEIPFDEAAFAEYRDRLAPLAERLGAPLPEHVPFTDDHFDAKVQVLIDERVPVASFTFGCPDAATVARLHAAEVFVVGTVTCVDEALIARESGVDALCAQGVSAGGHRGTFGILDADPGIDTLPLLTGVADAAGLPVIAAGGVASRDDVIALLEAGAAAVQVGTLLLRCPEAGTKQAHRDALADPRFTETVTTRAYSGRLARGLVNEFIAAYSDAAPPVYPQVNTLTGGIRRAGSTDPDVINLWAGTGFRAAQAVPAADVVAALSP